MSCHVLVLPDDILQTIANTLNGEAIDGLALGQGLNLLRLPHPRTRLPALFLPHELPDRSSSMILELQAVRPPNSRSWFMPEGEVVKDGQLLILTPIDPVFLLIPVLQCACTGDDTSNFRSAEDLFEAATPTFLKALGDEQSAQPVYHSLDDLLRLLSYQCITSAMKRICDTKEITEDIVVYRYSQEKTMKYLKAKVNRLSTPAICEMSTTIIRQLAKDGLMDDGNEQLLESAHIKAACQLLSQYLSTDMVANLLKEYNFAVLDAHLLAIRAEQTVIEEDNALASATKKGKAQTEKRDASQNKRKATAKASNGVEKLKKVNVKGMAKISSFFQKPA